MKLEAIYKEIVKRGIEADPRGKKEIALVLSERKKKFSDLEGWEKEFFDNDSLFNPFSDTRILAGDKEDDIHSVIVGIDIEGPELLLVDRLKEKGVEIGLVMAHHPEGKAYAQFYEVMDVQSDIFKQQGVNLGLADALLDERKSEVERRVNAANHTRAVEFARWLNLNFMCVHTPADNLAYRYMEKAVKEAKPRRIKDIIELLMNIPEYKEAARNNNPPKIFAGSNKSRVSKVHIEFTGGTEGPKDIYDKLSGAGVDTIIAMHQSEEHVKQCRKAHINVVVASHISSDTLGMNLMLDYVSLKTKLKVYEFSGFKRVSRKHALK